MFTNALCYEGPLFADSFTKNFYLNIFGCAGLCGRTGFSAVAVGGGCSCVAAGLELLLEVASLVGGPDWACRLQELRPQTLGHRLHRYGARAQPLCSTWDLPAPGWNPCLPPSRQGSPLFTDCNPPSPSSFPSASRFPSVQGWRRGGLPCADSGQCGESSL